MDFLSNLIKRPMSLVMNDSQSSEQTTQSPSKSQPCTPTVETNDPTTPVSINKYTALRNSTRVPNGGEGLSAISTINNNSRASSPKQNFFNTTVHSSRRSPIKTSPNSINMFNHPDIVANCVNNAIEELNAILYNDNPVTSSSLKSSTSSNSSAVEEMLLEINENLDKVMIEHPIKGQRVKPTTKLSPLSNKTMATKVTASPQIKINTPTASATAAAGTASTETNSSLTQFLEHEIETDLLQNTSLNSSGVNRTSNKFIGLTEFDESKIPDLPDCLNPNIEEQLKTTFEDGLIPTLTANISTSLNSNTPLNSSLKTETLNTTQLIANHDVDTGAISSDSEAYSECQTEVLDQQKSKPLFATEAFGSPNVSVIKENLAQATEVLKLNATNIIDQHAEQQYDMLEDEPMDIDFNLTQDFGANAATDATTDNYFETEQANLEKSLNKSIELPRKFNQSFNNEGDTNIKGITTVTDNTNEIESLDTAAVTKPLILNMTLDMTASFSSAKSSAAVSPTFPITNTMESNRFPHSPLAAAKKMSFLEKSDYTTELENSKNITTEINIKSPDPSFVIVNKCSLNETNDISSIASPLFNINMNAEPTLNSTFNRSPTSASTPNCTVGNDSLTTSHEKQRRTFTISLKAPTEVEEVDQCNDTASSNNQQTLQLGTTADKKISGTPNELTTILEKSTNEKHNTFNFGNNTAEEDMQINKSMELMDVDESMSAAFNVTKSPINAQSDKLLLNTTANKLTSSMEELAVLTNNSTATEQQHSPPIPTLQNRKNNTDVHLNKTMDRLTSPITAITEQQDNEKMHKSITQERCTSPVVTMAQHQHKIQMEANIRTEAVSPPIPTLQNRQYKQTDDLNEFILNRTTSPTISAMLKKDENATNFTLASNSPPIRQISKRAAIHGGIEGHLSDTSTEALSIKEQIQTNAKDEKDIFVDKFTSIPMDELFAKAAASQPNYDSEFEGANNLIFQASDFDYLLTKGNNPVQINRSSLLLKFDPLLGVPVPTASQQQTVPTLCPTIEEEENNESFRSLNAGGSGIKIEENSINNLTAFEQHTKIKREIPDNTENNASMSVDVIKEMNIENDCKKAYDISNTQLDEKQNDYKMDELEKKIKNEVLKTEDIEKKLKEADQREENYVKRISDKDKAITKMHGVIEAYEKAIAELISEKEQLVQSYEQQLQEARTDRDSNYHHLMSLETTFSDLHVKYEKSKEMTQQLKKTEESLLAEKRQNLDNLRLQEQRYERMKNHAMQQLEIANNKLESLTKEHQVEITKLKALLKKEEISRASVNEQLQQKTRENAELVKICDELINGQGS